MTHVLGVARRRRVVGCAALAVALLGGPAVADPATSCKLVVDPAGDAEFEDQPPPIPAPSLDLVGGDFAADEHTLTAVIRVAGLPDFDPGAPTGLNVQLHFTVERRRGSTGVERKGFALEAARSPAYDDFFYLWTFVDYIDHGEHSIWTLAPLGPVTGVFDGPAGEIRIHAPLAQLGMKPRVTTGQRIRNLRLWSFYESGFASPTESRRPFVAGGGSPADFAEGDRTYVVGDPSCVTVGR